MSRVDIDMKMSSICWFVDTDGVDVERAKLIEVGEAEQRVAEEDLVVDEGERQVAVEGDEPERELAHLDAMSLMSAP